MHIRQMPASEFLRKLVDILNRVVPGPITLRVEFSVPVLNATFAAAAGQLKEEPNLVSMLETLQACSFIVCTTANVSTTPTGAHASGLLLTYGATDVSGVFQLVTPSPCRDVLIMLLGALKDSFSLFSPGAIASVGADDCAAKTLRAHEIALASLESHSLQLQTALTKIAAEQEERVHRREADLEARFRERADTLESEHKKKSEALEAGFAAKEAALALREKDFETRRGEFETREARFVRRSLQEKEQGLLEATKTTKLSRETVSKRKPIHVVLWALLAAGFAGFIPAVLDTLHGANDWRVFARLASSFGVIVTTFFYYLRWMDRWFREHADIELFAGKYGADMVRAAWIAELMAETRQEDKQAELPPLLLEALTRDLFRPVATTPEQLHPMESAMKAIKGPVEIETKGGKLKIGK